MQFLFISLANYFTKISVQLQVENGMSLFLLEVEEVRFYLATCLEVLEFIDVK